jgi:ketosteroid isomerase-like protein
MRIITLLCHLSAAMLLSACSVMTASSRNPVDLQHEVAATERAFAKSMADRDHAAFSVFLSDEAVFFSGPKVLHGKQQVAAAWKRFFEAPTAPFSWQPEQVEVLASGSLAISSGPVHNAQGKLIATFSSIWRQEAPGVWRIVFDKGNEVCDCARL